MTELSNKSILIIGGSSGIGLAIAKLACKNNAKVTIASRSLDKLKKARQQLSDIVKIHELDVTDENAVEKFFKDEDAWDHVVTTAGSPKGGDIKIMATDEAKENFANMFWRAYIIAKYAKIADQGSLVLTSGIIGAKPFKNVAVIAAAAGALESFARAIALDLSPVRVNVIAPGFISTPLHGDNADEKLKTRVSTHLIARAGTAEEAGLAAIFFMQNNYVTGQTLYVDGGYFLS